MSCGARLRCDEVVDHTSKQTRVESDNSVTAGTAGYVVLYTNYWLLPLIKHL